MDDLLPLALPRLPERAADSHKGTYGRVLVIAGSRRYPGAAILSALGAGRGGAGLVALALADGIVPAVVPAVPFAVVRPCPQTPEGGLGPQALGELLEEVELADIVVVGPGLGPADATGALLAELLPRVAVPLVLDADGLNHLARRGPELLGPRPGRAVLLPHPGEFARLEGRGADPPRGAAERRARAVELSRRTGAVVVLKGAGTVVTDGRRVRVERAGNPGMATGGVGDVLAGLTGALLAVLPGDPAAAAALAVHAHARAGDLAADELGPEGVLPEDVALRLGRALRAIRSEGGADSGAGSAGARGC